MPVQAFVDRFSLPGGRTSIAVLATAAISLCHLNAQPATAGAGTTNCADLDPSGTGMPAVGAANFFVNAAPGDQIL
ncbi:MAG: hypothetical protein AAFO79_11580, partial [Pseudomonadota bacterium]